ncbi:hypothetical protein EVG20_g7279, partial [Dentipellis fragilis]
GARTRYSSAATGASWTAGGNHLGQCAHSPCPEVSNFRLVNGPHDPVSGDREHIVKAFAGITFTLFLTKEGKVYSCGSGEKGQLGNGRTGEYIATGNKTAYDIESEPILIKALQDKKIVQIACGQQHSIALDDQGLVYVWGYNGYCRLGLGNQQDVLTPKVVPQFAGPQPMMMGAIVAAGPSNSVVVDKQGMYYMAGKWKNTGDGSGGQPYSSFRFMQDIMACKMTHVACGGVTHFALSPDEEEGGVMTIAWGQNAANGELGLGPNEPKSATKPTRNQPLIGIDVFDVIPGQNTTYFLVSPNEKYSDLPRHPLDLETSDTCVRCNRETSDDDAPLECEKCDTPYHLGCLDPPLKAVPDGEWFCPACTRSPGAPVGGAEPALLPRVAPQKRGKRKAQEEDEEDEDAEGESEDESARKGRGKKAPTKRKK